MHADEPASKGIAAVPVSVPLKNEEAPVRPVQVAHRQLFPQEKGKSPAVVVSN